MPREELKYYRARKVYTKEDYNSEWFKDKKQFDYHILLKQSSDDVYLPYEFTHFNDGLVYVEYFENEDEMMAYQAIVLEDEDIYKRYISDKEERAII